MKNNLTPDQLKERKKKNIFKILGVILLLIMIGLLSPKEKEVKSGSENSIKEDAKAKEALKNQKLKLDTVISEIKKDKDFNVVKIEYTPDSTLKIYLPNVKSEITANGFNNLYQIMDIGIVTEIEVYKNEKYESSFGYRTQAKFDKFKADFVSSWDGSCTPVIRYIKNEMNDPESFEHDKTFVTPLLNGNFEVKTIFRGKNAFGGKVKNSCFSEVTSTGAIVSFKME